MQAQIYAVFEKHYDVKVYAKAGMGNFSKTADQISMQSAPKLGAAAKRGDTLSLTVV